VQENVQVTVEDLLKKIGALTVQGDFWQSQIAALQEKIAKLEDELEKLKDQGKK